MGRIIKYLTDFTVGVGIASLLCGGCYLSIKAVESLKTKNNEINPIEIKSREMGVPVQLFDGDVRRTLYIQDLNNDSIADVVQESGFAFWIAPEIEEGKFFKDERTKIMSPALRELATKHMNSSRDLTIKFAEEAYKLSQIEKKKD